MSLSIEKPLYLDHPSTTPMDPQVLEVMLPYLTDHFGNASSTTHVFGWQAQAAVKLARESLADHFNVQPDEIVFTSGATESNNLAIKGPLMALQSTGHLVTQATEHACVLESARFMEKMGHELSVLPVDNWGQINMDELDRSLRTNTILCSVMAANNEIGTLQPVEAIADLCHERKILFHTDASQAIGWMKLPAFGHGLSMMSFSGHKIYGPKGIGALIVSQKKMFAMQPLLHGGGHENGLRSGSLHVAGIVGLAKAVELSFKKRESESHRLSRLRDLFVGHIKKALDHVVFQGSPTNCLPHLISVTIKAVAAENLIRSLPMLAFSTGSACSSHSTETSHVLSAIGLSPEDAKATVRFGLGRSTTEDDVHYAVDKLVETVKKLRAHSIEYEMLQNRN